MPIDAGAVIGPYQIVSLIGTGGMGEVYQATDRQLNRAVAIKFLRSPFASEPDRIARFKMEAHLVASLNHPNIAAVYGLAEMQSERVLVMEFVDGRTLADCIAQGPMPVEEVLLVAKQIAEALEYAHDRGVIHRDLKPANIKLTPEGRVKILDFGLAKAMRDDLRANMLESTRAPTETQPGVILGSVAYMSPEQAKGIGVDRRTDIWAFGVILYELLIGRRLFKEQTTSETIAAVLKRELTWEALPSSTPPPIRRLLQRCLTRDPHRRLRDMGEARLAIDEVLANPDPETSSDSNIAPSSASEKRKARWVQTTLWIIALGVVVSVAATGLAPWRMREKPTPVLRLNAALGIDATLSIGEAPAAFLSPDGKILAFTAVKRPGDKPQIYLRQLDQLQAAPIADTEGVLSAFFSASSRWIAFFADGKLKKVSVTGGAPVTLADAPSPRGGSWSQEDTIVFATNSSPIMRVSSGGGKPQAITTFDNAAGETSHRWPQMLPDGKTILFTTNMSGIVNYDSANIVVQSLPRGERKIIQRDAYYGRYLASGHLVFMHNGTLFGVPFDLKRLEMTAQPVPILEGVKSSSISGGAQFSFSDTGSLVYSRGNRQASVFSIQWLAQDGSLRQLRGPENYANIRFSPERPTPVNGHSRSAIEHLSNLYGNEPTVRASLNA